MGGAQSKTNTVNKSNQIYITENTANILNKNANSAVTNALIKNNASCTTTNDINQTISFKGCKVAGDINITGVKQEAMITVDFSCMNAFKAENDMAQAILSELMYDLTSKMTTDSLNNMDTNAQTSAATSGILGSPASANTTTINKFNLQNVSTSNTNVQNAISTSVQSNFTAESIQDCLSRNAASQLIDFSNCQTAGNLNVSELEQKAGITAVVNCVNNSGAVQKVTNDVAYKLGVTVETETQAEVSSTMKNVISTSAESTGLSLGSCPCPGCGDPTGVVIWLVVICCLCLLSSCCVFIGYKFLMPKPIR